MEQDLQLILKALLNAQAVRDHEDDTIPCEHIEPLAIAALKKLIKMDDRRALLKHYGYTVQSTRAGGWYALLPGETVFLDNGEEDHKQNYVGFFSSEEDLLSEVYGNIQIVRSDAIKEEYLQSGCQKSDLDEAIQKLMTECADMFENEDAAAEFLLYAH